MRQEIEYFYDMQFGVVGLLILVVILSLTMVITVTDPVSYRIHLQMLYFS